MSAAGKGDRRRSGDDPAAYRRGWDRIFGTSRLPELGRVDRPARLTRDDFDDLPEYSASLPTGTTPGKRWKRDTAQGWFLGEYVEINEDGQIGIRWQPIEVVDEQGSPQPDSTPTGLQNE